MLVVENCISVSDCHFMSVGHLILKVGPPLACPLQPQCYAMQWLRLSSFNAVVGNPTTVLYKVETMQATGC